MSADPLKVLVVDDSPSNRQALIRMIDAEDGMQVVGSAATGSEALRMLGVLNPEAITLDLEMPQMDGFSFLRLVMNTRPTPVIVVSSNDQKENVFRALELGAVDFVAKPEDGVTEKFRQRLIGKLSVVRSVRPVKLPTRVLRARSIARQSSRPAGIFPRMVVAIASSTGGPTALTEILSNLKTRGSCAILIAQHMPPRFTTTFAQRLNRYSPFEVSEAVDGDGVFAGRALVCPGDRCMELRRAGGELIVRVGPPAPDESYVPNATRLLRSVGLLLKTRAVGVVLTGMGDDGAEGARVIEEFGGRVIVESDSTAIVPGMPRAAQRAALSAVSIALDAIPHALGDLIASH